MNPLKLLALLLKSLSKREKQDALIALVLLALVLLAALGLSYLLSFFFFPQNLQAF